MGSSWEQKGPQKTPVCSFLGGSLGWKLLQPVSGETPRRVSDGVVFLLSISAAGSPSLLSFSTQDPQMASYQVVELRILTNWGHPEYTCIYRFRVHGEPTH